MVYKQRWLKGSYRIRDSRDIITKCNVWTWLGPDVNKPMIKRYLKNR